MQLRKNSPVQALGSAAVGLSSTRRCSRENLAARSWVLGRNWGCAKGKIGATWALFQASDPTVLPLRLRRTFEERRHQPEGQDSRNPCFEAHGTNRGRQARTLDATEFDICGRIAKRIDEVLVPQILNCIGDDSLRAISALFDEHVVAAYLTERYRVSFDVAGALNAVRSLSGQTYENRALAFGCIFERGKAGSRKPQLRTQQFPRDFVHRKKFKALSDGFRTAFRVRDGASAGWSI